MKSRARADAARHYPQTKVTGTDAITEEIPIVTPAVLPMPRASEDSSLESMVPLVTPIDLPRGRVTHPRRRKGALVAGTVALAAAAVAAGYGAAYAHELALVNAATVEGRADGTGVAATRAESEAARAGTSDGAEAGTASVKGESFPRDYRDGQQAGRTEGGADGTTDGRARAGAGAVAP